MFNTHWDGVALPPTADQFDATLRAFCDGHLFTILNKCWSIFMHKGKPCVWEKQALDLPTPYAQPRVVKEVEFKRLHREMHINLSRKCIKKSSQKLVLFDIWSVSYQRAPTLHRSAVCARSSTCLLFDSVCVGPITASAAKFVLPSTPPAMLPHSCALLVWSKRTWIAV